ncbi:hypothetical protein P5F73_00810 [Clostridium perfringens]|nr:hypothetical protein [Clostridium perfringens]
MQEEKTTYVVPGYKKGTTVTVECVFPAGKEIVEIAKAKVIASIISNGIEKIGGNIEANLEYAKKTIEETW